MFKTKTVILFIITISVVATTLWYISTHVYSLYGDKIETVKIGNSEFRSEVVSSDAKIQKGLGGRSGLYDSCAMLFKFPRAGTYSFWMKDMRFPLDIIWILDGKIVHIEKNISEKFSGTLSPQVDADSVLEINAGIADKIGIKISDKTSFN
jgi:uncharacterized membrane protein (UPF0127 family)